MRPMADGVSTPRLILILVIAFIVVSLVAGLLARAFIRRGLRVPFIVRFVNRTSERVIGVIKRPITLAVLDEVSEVLQAGHFTRATASALQENRDEIKAMIAEKIKQDPRAGRIGLLPFHDRIINEASETTLRVILEVLADPRTDELVADLLRDNIRTIRAAVRQLPDVLPAPAAVPVQLPSRSPSVSR